MAEVIDLLSSDEEELPPLAARLLARAPGAPGALAAPAALPAPPQQCARGVEAAPPRPPLAAVHNGGGAGSGGSGSSGAKLAAAAAPLLPPRGGSTSRGTSPFLTETEKLQRRRQERAARKAAAAAAAAAGAARPSPSPSLGVGGSDSLPGSTWQQADLPPRPQYHQQEQQEQQEQYPQQQERFQQPGARVVGAAARARRPPTRSEGEEDDAEEEWRPSSSGVTRKAGRPPAAAKGGKKPRRTPEEAALLKAQQARRGALRDREDAKRLKQAGTQKWALQQVRLLVDAALVSSGSGGGGTSLGVSLLGHIDTHNERLAKASAEKHINYAVEPLGLAPFKALRWQRRRLVDAPPGGSQPQPGGGALDSQASAAAAPDSQLVERWEDAPHIMICFQPEDLVEAVRRDRLASLFALLERRAPGHRPYLLVVGLDRHIQTQDRRAQQADLRAGPQALGQVQQSARPLLDDFIAELAVECPRLGFRDAVDAAQAAQHVQLITAAIAKQPFQESDASIFLKAHDKGNSQAMTNMLVNHPLDDDELKHTAKALAALPSVPPGAALALASYYGSLGGLMDELLDERRSDRDKAAEIADMRRVGGAAMRVGPAAAKQLLSLLRCRDPGMRIKGGEEAA